MGDVAYMVEIQIYTKFLLEEMMLNIGLCQTVILNRPCLNR